MTPAKQQGADFQFVSWRVPQSPRAIEYPFEVMEEIRAFACDELLQLSHAGHEVGGVLFGTRREDLVRILTWRPIACDQADGEGWRLSNNDRMNLAVQLEVARQNPDLKDLRPVGWFVSHLRGDVSLSTTDLETYNGFFPEAWQATLVICPQGGGRAQAGFFVRESDGKVQPEASYQTFDLDPMHAAPSAPEAAPAIPAAPAAPPQAVQQTAPPLPQSHPQPLLPPPVARLDPPKPARPPQERRQDPPPRELPTPSFQTDEGFPTRERWMWAIPVVLALGIAAFLLYQHRAPAAAPSLAFRASNEAQTVQLVWDANSRFIGDAARGEIEINDGGKNSQVPLTSEQLHAGKLSYLPKSSDVGFVMTVYPANGDPIQESTRLIASAFNAPIQPPQLLTPLPPSPGSDALKEQVHQLTDDLRKERARADQLQNLVRILENRLGIQPDVPKPEPH